MVALFMMLQSSGVGISNISISEIIAISIVSVVLVLAGSYLCLYQYKEQQEINRQVRKAGLDILHRIITHEKQMAIKGM